MSKNKTLIRELCSPYCAYYKAGKNEELMCRGALLVDRLVHSGRTITPVRAGAEPDAETIETIVDKMCKACDFYEHDCDFMEDRRARPCGGFILLSRLVMSGEVQIDELKQIDAE